MLWILQDNPSASHPRARAWRLEGYDERSGTHVARAPDEATARRLVAGLYGPGGGSGWLDPGLTSCVAVDPAGPDEVLA